MSRGTCYRLSEGVNFLCFTQICQAPLFTCQWGVFTGRACVLSQSAPLIHSHQPFRTKVYTDQSADATRIEAGGQEVWGQNNRLRISYGAGRVGVILSYAIIHILRRNAQKHGERNGLMHSFTCCDNQCTNGMGRTEGPVVYRCIFRSGVMQPHLPCPLM